MPISVSSVAAFVALAQPEQMPTGLSKPTPTDHERFLLGGFRDTLDRYADALKKAGSTASTLGARHLLEALGKTLNAIRAGGVVELAAALADLVWAALWVATVHGIPLDDVFEEVRRARMSMFPECRLCGGNGRYFEVGNPTGRTCPDCAGKGRVVLHGRVTPPDIAGVLARAEAPEAPTTNAGAGVGKEHHWVLREVGGTTLSTDSGTPTLGWVRWRCRVCGTIKNTRPGQYPEEFGCAGDLSVVDPAATFEGGVNPDTGPSMTEALAAVTELLFGLDSRFSDTLTEAPVDSDDSGQG